MKKTNFLFSMVAAIVLLWGMSAYAQTNVNVSSAADLRAAVTTLSSTGGTITLVPPFTGNPTISGVTFAANALGIGGASTSQIVLSANAPITIDCGTNKITVYTTDNVSVAVGTLVIGNNITVTGTGAVTVDNVNRGILEVKDGGVVENRAASGGVANNAPNGRSVLSAGGTIATYSPNGAALKPSNSMTTIVQGGTLIAEATGAVALNLSGTPGTNYPISNTTMKATGSGAIGILSQGGWTVELANDVITTSSTDNTDIGVKVVGGGAAATTGCVWIPATGGTTVTSTGTKYVATNNGSAIDLSQAIIISANPSAGGIADGTDVTFTAAYADGTPVAAPIVTNTGAALTGTPAIITGGALSLGGTPATAWTSLNTVNVMPPATVYAAIAIVSSYNDVGRPAGQPGINSQLLPVTQPQFAYTVPVTTFAELRSAIQALEGAGTGGTIQLGDNITVKSGAAPAGDETGGADHEALLSSTVPVTVDCGNYQIISNGTGSSGTSVKLTIGNNITITGSGALSTVSTGVTKNVLINTQANGRVHVGNGGKVIATGDVAINGMAGRLSMGPGSWVEVISDGGIAIQSTQNFTVWLYGGTIKATGTDATALYVGGLPGTANTIKDVTIIADGDGAVGFHAEPLATGAAPGRYVLQGSTSITTTSTAKTDIGISVTAGVLTSGSIVIIPADNTGGVSSTGMPYSIDATTGAAVLDLTRPITINATPVAGTVPAGPITLKAQYTDDNTMVAVPIYYTGDGTQPTTTSTSMVNGGTFDLTADTTIIAGYLTPGITYTASGYETSAPVTSASTVYSAPTPFPSFAYTVSATSITTFAELSAAIKALSDAGTPGTVKIDGNITVNSGASPAGDETGGVDHEALLSSTVPVTVDCGDYQIISNGTSSSGTSVKLTIGNNITITGAGVPSTVSSGVTKNVLINTQANGRVHIANDGKVIATGDVAINGMAGRLSMESGSWVEVNSDGGIAIQSTQNFTVWLYGGTIKATGTGATALYLGGSPGTAHTIKNVTIIADGDGAVGFHAEPLATGSVPGRYVLQGSTSIKTTSTAKTDIGISVTAGVLTTGSIVVIPSDNTGGVSSTGTPYSIDGATGAAVLDLTRPIDIIATPGAGTVSAGPVTLKVEYTDDNTLVTVPIYYTADDTQPTTASTSMANGGMYDLTDNVTLTAGYLTPGITYTASGYETSAPVASASTVYSAPAPFPSFAYELLSTGTILLSLNGEAYISGNTLYLPTDGSVKMYNVNGQFVLSASGTVIDVSSLIKGIYIINTGSQAFKVVKK